MFYIIDLDFYCCGDVVSAVVGMKILFSDRLWQCMPMGEQRSSIVPLQSFSNVNEQGYVVAGVEF